MGEEEKNYIIRQADMYIYGKSLREIAEIIGKSHITVRNNLTKKLRYADAIKYKIVMEKLEYNKEKSIEDEEVRTRILDAYELLVLKNKTEIANILNELSDKKAICIAKRSDSKGKKLADEQILTILKYQIKYMLETKSIARIFNIDRGTYSSRVRNLGPEYANLISDFDYLSDFYHNASLASRGIK